MIDPAIEQALAPSRKSWKDNIYQSKAFAFLTSSALAWTLLLLCLAGSYVLLKMPSLAPDDAPSTMTIEPIPPSVTEKTKAAAKSTSRPADAAVTKPTEKQSEKAPEASNPTIKESLTVEELNKQLEQLNQQLKKGIL